MIYSSICCYCGNKTTTLMVQVCMWTTSLLADLCVCCPAQIIHIAPMPMVQTNVHPAGAVHAGSPFPVSMATATVMTPGIKPPQTVLLTSPPTRYSL